MTLTAFDMLPEEIKQHVRARVGRFTRYAFALVVDGKCRAVLLWSKQFDVVECEPEFFISLVQAIEEFHVRGSARGNDYFVLRPAKRIVRHLFVRRFFRPTSTLAAYCGHNKMIVLRSAELLSGFFDGPPVIIDAAIGLLFSKGCAWRPTLMHARRDGNGDVTVAFDPPVLQWTNGFHHPDAWSIMLRTREELVLDNDIVRVNKLSYHGKSRACTSTDVSWPIDGYDKQQVVFLSSVTISAARLASEDAYKDTAYPLLRAVGAIEIRRRVAAKVIGRAWRRAMGCPEYELCRVRLMREFEDLDMH